MIDTPQKINFENTEKQIAVKVLSNEDNFYAIWIKKDSLVMEISYSKKDQTINILDGTLGKSINESKLTEKEKISRCAEALEHVLWEYTHSNDIANSDQKSIKPNKLR